MYARRVENGFERPRPVTIDVDGETVTAYPGESIACALLAAGWRAFRRTKTGALRAPFCNMGVCFECVVAVDGVEDLRACLLPVRSGMTIVTGVGRRG